MSFWVPIRDGLANKLCLSLEPRLLFAAFFISLGYYLGLLLGFTIIEDHGGEIGADNLKGGGARFYFTLPTTEDHLS